MELDAHNKLALVTGASGGIGKAIAQTLAKEGAQLALHYRSNHKAAKELVEMLPGQGHFLVQADLSEKDQVDHLKLQLLEQWDHLDILVNNAGVYLPHPLKELNDHDWWKTWNLTMDVNLNHPALLIKKLLPFLEKAKESRIINISSRGAYRGEPGHVAYGAAKAGLNALSQSLAQELATVPIYVYAVAPGFVKTGMTKELLEGKKGEAIRSQSPLKREADATEIAHAVCMLCSKNANYMTGAVIDVNGASYLR